MTDSQFKMEKVQEHYEVYINGEFYCSADNPIEAAKEIEAARYVWDK